MRAQDDRANLFVRHAVSTHDATAQRLFDEGLTFVYAYNRQAGELRFRQAAARDPSLAIAWWGVVLAVGPNIKVSMSENDTVKGLEAVSYGPTMEKQASADLTRWPDHLDLLRYFIHFTEPARADLARAKAAGIKPTQLDYFGHNVDFWFGGAVMQGDDVSARAAAAIWPTYSSDAEWIAAPRLGNLTRRCARSTSRMWHRSSAPDRTGSCSFMVSPVPKSTRRGRT